MFESSKQEMLGFEEDSSKIFVGLNFVLLGFDSTTQQKVRSKIVEGGGVDVGRYDTDCTHVIVDKVVYDDPICVAARSQGQTLVTSLWVEHSFDVGMLVDPASIIYRPLRDLNGIPGAKSLVICLTGYTRQDRDDIMTMVGLMGANFSKPLVANKVTHLICYKFEGEKYELAKKIKKIKLVNHQWLEDCLKTWQILPEADYDKSGYELEMMEVQAKDSEDEAQHTATKQQMQKEGASIWESLSAREKEAKPNEVPFQKVTPSRRAEIPASSPTGNAGNISSRLPLQSMDRTPFQPNIGSDFSSVSNINNKSPQSSASKYIALSYSRKSPREASLPLEPGQTEGNAGSFSVAELGKPLVNDCINLSSSRMEEEGIVTAGVKSLLEENLSHLEDRQSGILPEKRKVANSFSGSKLQRTDNNLDFVSEGASDVKRTEQSAPEPLTNKLLGFISHSPGNNPSNADSNADFNPQKDFPDNCLSSVMPEIRQECSEKVLQMSSQKRTRTNLDSSPETADVISNRPESAVNESMKPHNGEVPPPAANVNGVGKSHTSVVIDFTEGDASSESKPLRKKPMAKRTLGSRPRFGRGKKGNQKGPIHMSKKVSIKNSPTGPIEGEETEDLERRVSSEGIKVIFPPTDAELDKDNEMLNFLEIRNGETNKAGTVDDETEAPENQENNELDAIVNKKKSGDVDVPHLVDTRIGGKVVVENKQTDDKILLAEAELLICGEENLIVEAYNAPSDNKMEQGESTFMDNNGRKQTLTETKKNNLPSRAKLGNSSEGGRRKGAKNGSSREKAKTNKARGSRAVLDGNMIPAPVDMSENSIEMEKENRPVHTGTFNVNHKKQLIGKLTRGSNRKSLKKIVANTGLESVPGTPKVRIDPVWFILSGHKLQRKEFKQVIRHLKGRLCRDSHQWTYQATHFIVPDPIRRTEKFFAAAASGRWILKTDYLTASNEAGRFLAEEPYEWHRKGLNEDGAINLEAPRKWRLLRERTGHGAFYGMRIIIYGECIAPPLDTLKRVVKAGDGTILATSPPYSRFLESSGVDFAIISPGMPRVDIWVQEFLRHEIPCVSADYLVEYVCKPGYPLDRHVQYNTLAWAEKSFRNLENRMEQVVEYSTPQKDDDEDDTRCHACGSRDNGEEMLICGDESGSSGCGIGAHIGCCDPPLEEIPEEDWFCQKCRNRKNTEKRCRKSASTSKRK